MKAYSCDLQWVCIDSKIIAKKVRKNYICNSQIYFFVKWVEKFISEITLMRLCLTRVVFMKVII